MSVIRSKFTTYNSKLVKSVKHNKTMLCLTHQPIQKDILFRNVTSELSDGEFEQVETVPETTLCFA
jgi:hypothetical protein